MFSFFLKILSPCWRPLTLLRMNLMCSFQFNLASKITPSTFDFHDRTIQINFNYFFFLRFTEMYYLRLLFIYDHSQLCEIGRVTFDILCKTFDGFPGTISRAANIRIFCITQHFCFYRHCDISEIHTKEYGSQEGPLRTASIKWMHFWTGITYTNVICSACYIFWDN